eukprot:TRINITY_DN2585_c0_g1_i2.p1 TRINITY_DN2585_c0_g1~~TRINITY_DN2585_c0_g1_i2.p1  ORF type:complete len:197 (+),score=79.41 TRINITY_DN2585_c0_g1_i2:49-639(+)
MIRRPPRYTQSRSSAASDVYKRQASTAISINNNGGERLGLQRIESQRVLDQSQVLSSSIQNSSSMSMQPLKTNVWSLCGPTDSEGNIGVFKSEEATDMGLEQDQGSTSSRSGFGPNSGYIREVAAYKLDHHSWVGVPPTIAYKLMVEGQAVEGSVQSFICLLYTSDAADDLLCVYLGGRRIIKKKNTQHYIDKTVT